MIRRHLICLAFLMSLVLISPAHADKAEVDFRKFAGQDAYAWLESQNFILERAADNKSKTKIALTKDGLVIEALKAAQSIIALKKGHLENYQDAAFLREHTAGRA